jgi:hypothetical protein
MRPVRRISRASRKSTRVPERRATTREIIVAIVWLGFYLAMFVTVVASPYRAAGLLAMHR